jgi:hypothetical protein
MSSLAELDQLVGFFSYSREDDEAFEGLLSALRDGIQRELSAQLGRPKRSFRLWQDVAAIAPGKLWASEIKAAIEGSFFFIPIVTPRSVSSQYCAFEFESFLAREKAIGRNDLVFPILYIAVPALQNEAKWRDDVVLSTIGHRQYVDWRPLRHLDPRTTAVREQIERLCQQIVEALNEPWVPPEERRRIEEAMARQHAEEEEARRLEAEANRRAEKKRQRLLKEAMARQRAAEEARRLEVEAEEERQRVLEEAMARQRAEEEAALLLGHALSIMQKQCGAVQRGFLASEVTEFINDHANRPDVVVLRSFFCPGAPANYNAETVAVGKKLGAHVGEVVRYNGRQLVLRRMAKSPNTKVAASYYVADLGGTE